MKSHDPQRWICYRCYLKELPVFNTQNLSEETISITDQTIQNNGHSEALETNRNHLSIAHLNAQSMSSTSDEFQIKRYHHPFEIIALLWTWLWNDTNLPQYVQITGYSFCYKNRDKRRGSVGMYIKRYKLDEIIEHMWIECQGKNKNKDDLLKARYNTFSNNNNLEQNHRDCRRYQYWLQQSINCTWNIQRSTWHVELKTTSKKSQLVKVSKP